MRPEARRERDDVLGVHHVTFRAPTVWEVLRDRTWRLDAGAAIGAAAVAASVVLLSGGHVAGLLGVSVGIAMVGLIVSRVVGAASIDERLDIFDRGVRWSQPKAGRRREVRWERVADLEVVSSGSPRWGRATQRLRIEVADGQPVLVDGRLRNFLHLVCYVEHGAHQALAATVRRELRADETVPFGALHLCRIGLVVDGRVIGWRRVADVEVEGNMVYVYLRDGRRLEAGARSSIRSAHALIHVIDELAGHAARLERVVTPGSHHRAAFH